MSNEGYANLAAALLSFFGSRSKARREDRRDRQRQEREDKRHTEEMDLRRSDLAMRGDMAKETVGLQREAMDRRYPKKTWADDLMGGVKSVLGIGKSPQDRLIESQAGYNDAITDQIRKGGMGGAGRTPPYFPGSPRLPGAGRKPSGSGRAPKEPTMDLVEPEEALNSIAKDLVAGTQARFRGKGMAYEPKRVNWKAILEMNRKNIARRMGREPSEEELSSLLMAIAGGTDPTTNQPLRGMGENIMLMKGR